MIGSTRTLRVWAYPTPADLRKGFDGLAGLVATTLQQDPLRGDCYLFVNRDRTRAKVLVYDGTGLCIYQKRLEQGRFAALWARDERQAAVELTLSELALLLEGARIVGRLPLSPPRIGPRAVGAVVDRLQAS